MLHRRSFVVLSAFVLLATPLFAQKQYFSASLDGAQEVPAVATTASGWGVVEYDTATGRVDIFVHTVGVLASAAHLHLATRGNNGGVLVPLAGGPSIWTGGAVLGAANAARMANGGTYLNVHSAAHPGGEIRGQVEVARATRYVASLDGLQEVPPNNSTAVGSAMAIHYEPDNILTYEVVSRGLQNVSAAHIHRASRGNNGPVIHPLTGSGGNYCGSTVLSAADVQDLQSNGLYFNIHTSQNPGGEIRGQIRVSAGDFFAHLNGAQEVPPVATTALGQACVTLNPDLTLTYIVRTAQLQGATAAHFHKAPAASNGPVVIPLVGGPTVWQGTTRSLTAPELADLRAGDWYVNAHTPAHPGGEIRGQIGLGALPTTYGRGCPSGSNLAQISCRGFPCLGDSFEIRAHSAEPNVRGEVVIGIDRGSSGALRLPMHLGVIGMPDCFLLTDLLIRGLGARTDANGCAELSIPLPLDVSLRGGSFNAQWLFFVPGANPAGGVVSNALHSVIR